MAAITRRRLGYILTNFANTLAVQAANLQKTRQALFHCSPLIFEVNQADVISTKRDLALAPNTTVDSLQVFPLKHKVQESINTVEQKGNEQAIKMPSLSPTMTEGKIVKWLKNEGDVINPGDVLCDIETDKAVISMETEEEGILAKILVPENTPNVKVGSFIAVMVPPGEDWKSAEVPKETDASGSEATGSSPLPKESDTQGGEESVVSGPSTTSITMPSLSPTMTAGTIVKWLKKEGDKIAPGDVLCDIQTDKAVMSLEAEEEGILAKIVLPDDSKDVQVGTLIAVVVPEGEDWKSVVVTSAPKRKEVTQPQFTSTGSFGASEVRGKTFGPAVKTLLSTYQLEPGLIKPSGKGNRILKEDVLQYITDNNLEKKPPKAVSAPKKSAKKEPETGFSKSKRAPAHVSIYKDLEISNVRMITAKRLLESKQQIPHCYYMSKCDVNDLLNMKEDLKNSGIKVSVNDLLTKATVLSLQMYPVANSLYVNDQIKFSSSVDICVAVATDAGLYTPIIRSAEKKTLEEISKEAKDLFTKARSGKLKPEEYQGGTFTITNLGMYGINHFKAIINPPQTGILAIGGIIESLNPDMTVTKQITLTLSLDSRVLPEFDAAHFMEVLKYFVENPKLITSGMETSSKGTV